MSVVVASVVVCVVSVVVVSVDVVSVDVVSVAVVSVDVVSVDVVSVVVVAVRALYAPHATLPAKPRLPKASMATAVPRTSTQRRFLGSFLCSLDISC